jgi:hypothetical protein
MWKNTNEKKTDRQNLSKNAQNKRSNSCLRKIVYFLRDDVNFHKRNIKLLIIKYKKIDDQIKKQLHEKFQTLKQSSFKN